MIANEFLLWWAAIVRLVVRDRLPPRPDPRPMTHPQDPIVAHLSVPHRGQLALTRLREQAQSLWLGVDLNEAAFACRLGAALRHSGAREDAPLDELLKALEELHTDDLYLAQAVTDHVPGAAQAFATRYHPEITALVTRFSQGGLDADDLRQHLMEVMCVGSHNHAPRLTKYSGRGPLYAWLRVSGTRLFIDRTRSGAGTRETPVESDTLTVLGAVSEDMEMQFLKKEYRSEFKEAFARAMDDMAPSERVLLRQSVVEQLSIDALGSLYGVHRATAARRLVVAKENLFKKTRHQLMHKLSIEHDEFDSIMAMIQSRLEASVYRLLEATPEDEKT